MTEGMPESTVGPADNRIFVLVLQHPRAVFVALRDDSKESSADRAEPVLLIVWLAGIAAVLADASTYLNDPTRDGVDLLLWAFIGGGISGFFAYLVLGWILHRVGKAFGSQGTFRRARHVIAFASVPIALSLVGHAALGLVVALWPAATRERRAALDTTVVDAPAVMRLAGAVPSRAKRPSRFAISSFALS